MDRKVSSSLCETPVEWNRESVRVAEGEERRGGEEGRGRKRKMETDFIIIVFIVVIV